MIGAALCAAFALLHADDKKTTKAPPPHKAATPAPKPPPATGTATSGAPKTYQPAPTTAAPTGTRTGSGAGPSGAPKSSPGTGTGTGAAPTGTGMPVGKRVYEPVKTAAPPGPSGSPKTSPPFDANRGSYSGRRMHEPATVQVHTWQGRSGSQAQFGADGSIRRVNTHGMTIIHAPGGGRQIVAERANHTRIVTNGAGHGYVQAPFNYRGHEYASRTYYFNGHTSVNYYRSYSYHNVSLVEYTPARYYSPVFYGWAYHPWARPVYYGGWGWAGSPWYSYYGGYFAPSPYYPSAAFWLTDFLIAASLQASYQQQVDAQAQAQAGPPQPYASEGGQVALTPEVKQAIAQEVQRQLALENSEGQEASRNVEPDPNSSGLPRTLADGSSHVFVVADPLDVSDSTGQSCVVSEGDVLQLQSPPPQDAGAGFLYVLASKDQDCPRGDVVTVAFADLQEMQNQMRASIDNGLGQLQAQSGQGGLPSAPQGAAAPPVQSAFAPIAPPPDPNVATELSQQASDAGRAEQQVMSEAGAGGSQ
jgi:hypothetical protein